MAILFIAVLIIAVAVIFSAQNSVAVTLSFIAWQFTASLAIIVFLAVLAGMVIMGLLWVGSSFRKNARKGAKPAEKATTNQPPAIEPGGPHQ